MASVNELVKLLQGLKTAAPKKRSRKNRSKKMQAAPATIPAAFVLPASSSKRRRGAKKGGSIGMQGEGVIRLKKRELLLSVSAQGGLATKIWPTLGDNDKVVKVMPFLAKLVGSFDRIVWHSVVIEWKPTVGTSTNGSFSMGCDWGGGSTAPKDKGTVLALSPNSDGAVYQPQSLRLAQARLMSKSSYNTTSADQSEYPFTLMTYASSDAKNLGDIWITYDVTLMGTQ